MIIQRKKYIEEIKGLIWKPYIKVLIWQRRIGKSILLEQISELFDPSDFIFLDFENYETKNKYNNDKILFEYLDSQISENNYKAVLLDEIQTVPKREEAVLGLWKKYPKSEFFLTGSNSKMLSSELTTLLRWRYYKIDIYPFSYHEFCSYFEYTKTSQSMKKFLEVGSYPSSYIFQDSQQRKHRTKQMIDSIMLKDIVERYSVKESAILYELFLYLISVSGNITNIANIYKHLESIWKSISMNTLQSYIWYFEENFMIYDCNLYDLQGKKVFDRIRKRYISDHSLRQIFFGSFDDGYGKAIENLVFMELKKAWRNITTGKKWDLEVDFIAKKNWKKIYIQVVYILANSDVIQREIWVFQTIKDSWPKYIVSMDELDFGFSEKWYQHIKAWELENIL